MKTANNNTATTTLLSLENQACDLQRDANFLRADADDREFENHWVSSKLRAQAAECDAQAESLREKMEKLEAMNN